MPYTRNPRPINRCQYWIEKEPNQCIYWDKTNTICIYEEEVTKVVDKETITFIQRGDLYPFCNYIGTARFSCTKYATNTEGTPPTDEEITPRCVLPDPYRHVSMSPHCSKWVTPPATLTTASGEPIPLDYTRINGYNEGKCNFDSGKTATGGTQVTCSGFAPHHLGFGIAPIQDVCTISGVTTSGTTTASGFPSGSHMPMKYDILNKRALLGRCRWWKDENYSFVMKQDTLTGKLSMEAPEFKCTNTSPLVTPFSDFYEDQNNVDMRPPCNGAMPDCPKYTGNLETTGFMPYLSSIYLRGGDKVMAEQVLELRYNIRKETWDIEDYNNYFGLEAAIFAHEGSSPEIVYDGPNNIVDYSMKAIKTEITDFDCFTIERKQVLLTKGTSSDNLIPSFPTLIKELNDILFEPIIRSVFDLFPDYSMDASGVYQYVFETPYSDHSTLLIVGEFFGYNSNLFAINISDPEFDFPFNDILKFKNMYDFREFALGVGNDKEYAEQRFKDRHAQLKCYFKLLEEVSSDKMYHNEWSATSGAFAIGVKTIFGMNKILVFDTSMDIYTFSTIVIHKVFCGGVIAQTSFEVTTIDTEVSGLVNYEQEICFPKFSPKVTYKFLPFKSRNSSSAAVPVHTYIDTKVSVAANGALIADPNPTYFLGYYMYRVKVMDRFFIDSACDNGKSGKMIFLGNEGYILLVIEDNYKLHSVIRKWDTGEVDADGNSVALKLYLNGKNSLEEDISIEMEVLEYCTSRMEVNQLLIKPKDSNSYVRLYNSVIEFEQGLYVYERWSFGMEPSGDYEEIRDGWPAEDVTLIRSVASLTDGNLTSGTYNIENLPTSPIIASVIFAGGITGRIKGQAKSDIIIWVKKPYCSDVEIMYTWQANYQETLLLPTGYCFVNQIGAVPLETGIGGSSPRCGDHYFGRVSRRPSLMWYPYTACDEYATYNLSSGNYENDTGLLEFWLNEVGKPDFGATDHGAEDLRMLGPAKHFGYTVDTHATVWACGCDYVYHNSDMISTPWFAGFARIRAGVIGEDFYYMTQNGGIGPKFGNKNRPYLHSFRSIAALHFSVVNDYGGISIDKKWLPMYETFSDMSLSANFTEYPWRNYFNESDITTTYINQFGLLSARNVDDTSISEELLKSDDAEGTLRRFRFSEVFLAHSTNTGMVYPAPRKQYYAGAQTPRPITAWLTYKDAPDGTDKSIQWAWRERWKPLERELLDIRTALMDLDFAICDTSNIHSNYLKFLDVNYTNYTYDVKIEEFRRIPEEGFHKIVWEPSKYDEENPLPTFFVVRIDEGPVRLLNTKLELVTDVDSVDEGVSFESTDLEEIKKHIAFYKLCSQLPWLSTISSEADLESLTAQVDIISDLTGGFILYDDETEVVETDEAAKKNATDGNRKVSIYKDGEPYDLYFNRGLYFTINSNLTKYIPKSFEPLELPYEFKLSKQSHDDTDYSVIDVTEFYPANDTFDIKYFFIAETVTIIFKFEKPINIGQIDISYLKGRELQNPDSEDDIEKEKMDYYHIPKVTFKKSEDDVVFEDVEVFDFVSAELEEEVANVSKPYKLTNLDVDYMSKLSSSFSVTFDFSLDMVNFTNDDANFMHYIFIGAIKFYKVFFTKQEEVIQVHERKFNISVGSYGTYPIHGFEGQGSLLYPSISELSTTYQYDTAFGMTGMANSMGAFTSVGKTQSRYGGDVQEDNESLAGSYLDFELKQKELYDDIAMGKAVNLSYVSMTKEVFKETLSNTGVTSFPEWTFTLKNSTIVPLRAVPAKQLYYPEGHNWTWDNNSFRDFFNCGGGGLRQTVTIFSYKWGRVSGIYGFVHERDILDLYSYGLSDALTRLANPDMAIAERLNSL